jgi:DNA-binding Lrp family transcriptional regulator
LPLRFDFVPFGKGDLGSDVKVKAGRPILVQYSDDKAEQERFLEALLELHWIAPGIRRAIMKALGRSLLKQKVNEERARTTVFKLMVDEAVARMQAKSERPSKGDLRTAAIEKVAKKIGMESEALAKRLQRLRLADTI